MKIGFAKNSKSVEIYVEDNGIGIEKQYQDKIYNMFYRATEISKGSGLGLYIAKETIAVLDGKIDVRSSKGHGSLFTVSLPITEN